MNADGSSPRQITNLSTEAGGVLFSPDGKKLLFTSQVYPDCPDDACNKTRLDAEKEQQSEGAQLYHTALPPLDGVANQAALALDGGGCGRRAGRKI